MLAEFRHALRSLRLRPGFSLLVVVTLALGIAANVALFEYVGYFVYPTVQAPEPERLVTVRLATPEHSALGFSLSQWRQLDEASTDLFEQLSARRPYPASLRGPEQTIHVWGRVVSGDYFGIFAKPPHLGRLLTPEDDRLGAPRVLVLSYEVWQRHFASDPDVVGTSVVLDGGDAYDIVGVTQPRFQGTGLWVSLYTPLATSDHVWKGRGDRNSQSLLGIGRLRAGVEAAAVEARLEPLVASFAEAAQEPLPGLRLQLASMTEPSLSEEEASQPIYVGARIMMWAALALMALACANIANLFLARGADRRRELAVQLALGAHRLRLASRMLLEAGLLALVGAGLGLLLSSKLTDFLHHYLKALPIGFGEWGLASHIYTQNWRLSLFVAGLTAGAALLFSLAPMLQTFRLDLVGSLKSDSAGSVGRSGGPGLRGLLTVTQVALSTTLLLTAGLLVRTLAAVDDAELGFDPEQVSVASLHVPTGGEALGELDLTDVYDTVLRRVAEVPGIGSAAVARRIPLSFARANLEVRAPGTTAEEGEGPRTSMAGENQVSENYFATFRIPILQGRETRPDDDADAPPVAVINRKLARELWPQGDAVGQFLEWGEGEDRQLVRVVGVAADHRQVEPTEDDVGTIFRPFRQQPHRRLMIVVRSGGPILQPLHRLLRDEFPDVSVIEVVPFAHQHHFATSIQRMHAELASGFGALGLLLAALGIFSVLAYGVARRRREIGIRMAIGARRSAVRQMILGETARLLAVGLVVGCALALAAGRLLEHMLWGVDAFDPATYLAVVVILAAMGLLAAWLPARRAARMDPMDSLRSE